MPSTIHTSIDSLASDLPPVRESLGKGLPAPVSGLCGFDGFIDTFIRMESPASMEAFGPKVTAAAGIATSFPVRHLGDKFGGNAPLFARALHDLNAGQIDLTYIGAVGDKEILPIFDEALSAKMNRVVTLADPAHSDCLEFTDGKIMLGDLSTCSDITWERFGAGCLTAVLLGLDDTATVLLGNCASGYFVRSGRTPDLKGLDRFLELWSEGNLPERL